MRYVYALLALLLLALQPAALSFALIATFNGTEGGSFGNFTNPAQISLDSGGMILIADSGNNRIAVYGPDLAYVTSRGGVLGNAPTELNGPSGAAVGPDGRLYIADTFNHRVQVYTGYTGTYYKTIPPGGGEGYALYRPGAVAVSSNGTVHVADTFNDRIEIFSPTGTFLNAIYSNEQFGNYVLNRPAGIFIDERNGWILVVDTGNNRVQVFDLNYTFLARLGWGEGSLGFSTPLAAASDRLGRIYVADTGNNRVQVFAKNFTFLTSIAGNASGSTNGDNSSFGSPAGVAVDSSGRVFISDGANGRVLVFQTIDVELEREYAANKIAAARTAADGAQSEIAGAQGKIDSILRSGCSGSDNATARLNFAKSRLELANTSLANAKVLLGQAKYTEASAEADTASAFAAEALEVGMSAGSMADSFVSLTGGAVEQMSEANDSLSEIAGLRLTADELNVTLAPIPELGLAATAYGNAKSMCAASRYAEAQSEALAALGNATVARESMRQQINIAVIPVYTTLRDEFLLAKSNITLYGLPLETTPLEMELSYANTLILDSNYAAALAKLSAVRTNLTALEARIATYMISVQQRSDALRSELAHQRGRISSLEALAANYSRPFDASRPNATLRLAEDNLTIGRLDDANTSLVVADSMLNASESDLRAFTGMVDNATAAIAQAQADIARAQAESLPLPFAGASLGQARTDLAEAQSQLYTDPQAAEAKARDAGNSAIAEYNKVRSRKPLVLGVLAVFLLAAIVIFAGMTGLATGALAIIRYVRKKAAPIEKAAEGLEKEAERRIIEVEEGLLGKKGKH